MTADTPRQPARIVWWSIAILFALGAGAVVAGETGSLAAAVVVAVLVTVPGIAAERWSA